LTSPSQPIIVEPGTQASADGNSFCIRDWRGSGPAALHVHHADDEAWHVLEGALRFRFADRTIEAAPGATVFVPAGVAHTYEALAGSRYLLILTPRLRDLIAELQSTREPGAQADIYRGYQSELLESA
jgi:mannose-6-phosphate isomerase-like protein (cupin superfamily)